MSHAVTTLTLFILLDPLRPFRFPCRLARRIPNMPPIRFLPTRRSRTAPKSRRVVFTGRSKDVSQRVIIESPDGRVVRRFEGDDRCCGIRLIDAPVRDGSVHSTRGEDIAMYGMPRDGYPRETRRILRSALLSIHRLLTCKLKLS